MATTSSIRYAGAGGITRDEHARAHEQVSNHFGVAGKHISKYDIAEFAILGFSKSS